MSKKPKKILTKNQKQMKGLKIGILVEAILLVLVLALSGVYSAFFGKMKKVDMSQYSNADLGITTTVEAEQETDVNVNIVLFGLSVSDSGGRDTDRSDTIIVCTIAPIAKEIRFTSILRDTEVELEGYPSDKLNIAYQYGGAPFAIKTLNQNFDTQLRDYVTIRFEEMEEIIDRFDGVDITLTAAEAKQINLHRGPEVYEGKQTLNGEQAIHYMSIRKIDSESARSDRQKYVLSCLFDKFKTLSFTEKLSFAQEFLPLVETSLDFDNITGLLRLPISEYKIVKNTIPDDNYELDLWGGVDPESGLWLWRYDLGPASQRLHNLMYK